MIVDREIRAMVKERKPPQRIPEDQLAEYWYGFMHGLLGELRRAYAKAKQDDPTLTQTVIAARLGRDPGQVSLWLNGRQNMTVRTVNSLARALGHRLNISLEPLSHVTLSNWYPQGAESWREERDGSSTSGQAEFYNMHSESATNHRN